MNDTMPVTSPPDWQLPPGVNRGLWQYLHDTELARGYDASLAGSSMPTADLDFARRFFPRPGRLLDLGCGTGRLLLPFAQSGFCVVGVDLSEEMLRVATAKAATAGVVIHCIQANIVQLEALADRSFDYAACLFSTLGMVIGDAERQRVIAHAFRLLRPGGKFILHVHNRWFNLWDAGGRSWLFWNWIESLAGRARKGDRVMPVHQGIAGLTLHLFTRRELVRLLKGAGFRLLEVRPVSTRQEDRFAVAGYFGRLRAYGYLLAAERPQ